MRVMCIYKWWRWGPNYAKVPFAVPVYGDFCNVVKETQYGYKLEEFPEPTKDGWEKEGFIPCSEIDETEMIREIVLEAVI